MNFISCLKVKQKAKVHMAGGTLDLLTLVVAICKTIAERISKEKGLNLDESMKFVVQSIEDVYKTLK
ncbi:hypothetical protein [Lacrimispora sp.]|uniref:hypothetical protein n=1 Tax=Lacrimispora sp. TaxID=2719234 RepID=UPI003994DD4E